MHCLDISSIVRNTIENNMAIAASWQMNEVSKCSTSCLCSIYLFYWLEDDRDDQDYHYLSEMDEKERYI